MSTGRCHREYGGKKEIVLSLGESQEGKIRLINTSMYNMRLKVDLKKKGVKKKRVKKAVTFSLCGSTLLGCVLCTTSKVPA